MPRELINKSVKTKDIVLKTIKSRIKKNIFSGIVLASVLFHMNSREHEYSRSLDELESTFRNKV